MILILVALVRASLPHVRHLRHVLLPSVACAAYLCFGSGPLAPPACVPHRLRHLLGECTGGSNSISSGFSSTVLLALPRLLLLLRTRVLTVLTLTLLRIPAQQQRRRRQLMLRLIQMLLLLPPLLGLRHYCYSSY